MGYQPDQTPSTNFGASETLPREMIANPREVRSLSYRDPFRHWSFTVGITRKQHHTFHFGGHIIGPGETWAVWISVLGQVSSFRILSFASTYRAKHCRYRRICRAPQQKSRKDCWRRPEWANVQRPSPGKVPPSFEKTCLLALDRREISENRTGLVPGFFQIHVCCLVILSWDSDRRFHVVFYWKIGRHQIHYRHKKPHRQERS